MLGLKGVSVLQSRESTPWESGGRILLVLVLTLVNQLLTWPTVHLDSSSTGGRSILLSNSQTTLCWTIIAPNRLARGFIAGHTVINSLKLLNFLVVRSIPSEISDTFPPIMWRCQCNLWPMAKRVWLKSKVEHTTSSFPPSPFSSSVLSPSPGHASLTFSTNVEFRAVYERARWNN